MKWLDISSINVVVCAVVVCVLAGGGSASADVEIADWEGGPLDIFGRGGEEEVDLEISGAPDNAYVTSIRYWVKVDDQGDEFNFWCSDYEIYIGNEERGAWYECVWDHQGGKTDEDADEDPEDDSDINLYRTLGTQFDGDSVNQKWYVAVRDNRFHYSLLGKGRLTGFRVEITYDVPQPDLVDAGEEYRTFSPSTVVAREGRPFEVSCGVQNGGDAAAGPFTVSFYVSRNTNINTDDYHLGDQTVWGLAAGQATDCHFSRSFPLHFDPPGTYYVGWIIDPYARVDESNEDNNTAYKQDYQLTVLGGPDLVDAGESYRDFTPTTVSDGEQLHASCRIRNDGDADAGPFGVGFYLSTDTTITAADYYIGGEEHSGLGQGQSTVGSCSSASMHYPPTGTYYVGWIIDGPDRVDESNEDNNTAYKEGYQLTVLAQVEVPNVVGMSRSDAESAVTAAGLAVGTTWWSPSDTVPTGDVVSQDPTAGTLVGAGSEVELTISQGPDSSGTVVVPDVTNLAQTDAQSALVGVGLVVGTVGSAASDTVPAGHVISQDPAGGATVSGGAAVDLVVCGGSQPVGPAVPGAVAHWKLDEVEGPIAFDSAGANDGVLYGSPLWLPEGGIIDGALDFDGIDDYVAYGTFNPSAATGKLTICLWANWKGLSDVWQGLIAKRDSWSADDMMWQIEANRYTGMLGFFRQGSRPPDGDPVLPLGEWAHVAASFDGTTATFYFDGEPTGSGPFSFGPDTQAGLVLGAADRLGGNSFNGAFDDVRLYDQALSHTQIKVVMTGAEIVIPSESRDISTATAGSDSCENGVYTVTASGSDIWSDHDEFRYVYATLTGDFEISARVLSLENTDPWAKAGVMVRETLDADSRHAFMCVTPEQGEGCFAFQCRPQGPGEQSTSLHTIQHQVSFPTNTWVKIARQGNTFTGLVSENGTVWETFPGPYAVEPSDPFDVANPVVINMPQTVYVGLAVTSHNWGTLCTAQFDNVVISTGARPGPEDLLAHWAFDETAGRVALDSVGTCDGALMGGPVWQPTGGMVNGALSFDGSNDCVLTDVVLDPADGPFSVFAWIKGGAPGEVILSQDGGVDGADWLAADPTGGRLMTALAGSGPFGQSLTSAVVITDGQWHEVGLTWGGSNRTLYVDGIAVATNALTGLVGSTGGLNIGAGKNLDAGTFFTGLIDDVRIYNRAVKP